MSGRWQSQGRPAEDDQSDESSRRVHYQYHGPAPPRPQYPPPPYVIPQFVQYQPAMPYPGYFVPTAYVQPTHMPQDLVMVDPRGGWVAPYPYVLPHPQDISLYRQPMSPQFAPQPSIYPPNALPSPTQPSYSMTQPVPTRNPIYSSEVPWTYQLSVPAGPEIPDALYSPQSQSTRRDTLQPPSGRSHWAMWVGNIPSDATKAELWQVFSSSTGLPNHIKTNLLSVHLISKSNCAFVNYNSRPALEAAVVFFNGRPCRPHVLGCPRMSCRIRTEEDEAKVGRGVQRERGMHGSWVSQNERKVVSGGWHSGNSERGQPSSSSNVRSSTPSSTSSFLAEHFPNRYFVLKSLNSADLKISVEKGIWATQSHNENLLDRAYRTSQNVFLIFSANKSGEFFGYARMAGPIATSAEGDDNRGTGSIAEAGAEPSLDATGTNTVTAQSDDSSEDSTEKSRSYSDPHFHFESSPWPSDSEKRHSSAPPPIDHPPAGLQRLQKGANLPKVAKMEAVVEKGKAPVQEPVYKWAQWGNSFKVEWIHVEKLPFTQTRHLLNPWNNHLEVKVSRDGTELEPEVGRRLLEEWGRLDSAPAQVLWPSSPGERLTEESVVSRRGQGIIS